MFQFEIEFLFRLLLVAKAKIPIAMKGFNATKIGVSRWKNVNKLQTVLRITHAMSGQEIVSEVPNKIYSNFLLSQITFQKIFFGQIQIPKYEFSVEH